MKGDVTEEALTFLERRGLLAAIQEERLDRRSLETRFDVSRTTIYRATVNLEERGLIEPTTEGYRLTPYGRGVMAAIDQYRDALNAVDRLGSLLEYVDHPVFLRSLHLFSDAEVLIADPGEPYWLTEWLTDKLADVEFFRGLDPVMGNARQYEVAIERVEVGADMASVIDRERVSEWGDRTADRLAGAKRRFDDCNVFVGDVPLTLQVYDETVVVVGLDEKTGVPAVCAATDRAAARDWALTLFRQCWREAEPLEATEALA